MIIKSEQIVSNQICANYFFKLLIIETKGHQLLLFFTFWYGTTIIKIFDSSIPFYGSGFLSGLRASKQGFYHW